MKMNFSKKLFLAVAVLALAIVPLLAIPVKADTNTGTAGQPNQSCQNFFPVNGLQPRGFNTNGFNKTLWERLRVHDDVKVSGRLSIGDTDRLMSLR